MDSLYKPHFVRSVKEAMGAQFPEFVGHAIPRGHPMRAIFAGELAYRAPVPATLAGTVWLRWVPGPGAERYFNVLLGWSPGPEHLPQHPSHDAAIYGLTGPSERFAAASLDLEQIEGKAAIGGISIPSPWDQMLAVKPAAPRQVQQDVQNKASAEAAALSDDDRANVVRKTVEEVCARVRARLPAFVDGVRLLERDA